MMILEKHQNIKAEYQNGTSIDSLAFKYAYTENHIRQIVKSEGNVSKQMKLRQIIGEKVKKIGLLFR
jgi:Mor family transcriptional regulator